jgi:hypothetical protein
MMRKVFVGIALAGAATWMATTVAQAAMLCQKKSGALFVRDACKKKETAVDATTLLGSLSSQVTNLQSSVTTLQSSVTTLQSGLTTLQGNALTKASTGTVAGYATVDSDGTLVESYSSTGGAVASSRAMQGDYNISFGFQVRPDQPIVAVPRETFGHEICRVFLGSSPVSSVSLFCAQADAGSPAADVAFTIVVFN